MAKRTIPGQAGGNAVVRRYGTSYMSAIGSIGGRTVMNRYGANFYRLIGQLGNNNISMARRRRITNQINRTVAATR